MDIQNKEIMEENSKNLKRLSTPWKTSISAECCKYHRIPWFKLGFMGKEYKQKTKSECLILCNQYMACKSYSYNYAAKECIWSPQAVTYDSDWRFYSKKKNMKGVPDGTYHMFPGMKFLEPTTDIEKNKSLQECQYSCTKELGCNSFSYSEPLNQCARSGQAIGYSEEWEYYEKDLNSPSLETIQEKHNKENVMKTGAKREYLDLIDKVRRKAAADKKQEHEELKENEAQAKTDQRNDQKAEDDENEAETKAERKAKTASQTKALAAQFKNDMAQVTKKIDQIEKGVLEKVEKKLVTEKDTTTIAELKVEKQTADKELQGLKQQFDREKVKENGEKND